MGYMCTPLLLPETGNTENIFSVFPVSARGVLVMGWRRSGVADGELRAERGDDVKGGDGSKEKEKEVTSLKENEKEGRLNGRRMR
ncbi:hypothetical protein Scep_029595 [Stephania cephalantha]|uniref:Uncharacterized protein n=1 Tax=Stephania cephalantha TaxID=152367 RepID=A0AAP0E5M5_9MAGN